MRLTTILLLSTCLHLSANSRAQKITLSEHRSSLEKVFREIKKQTGYLFVYRDEWLKEADKVDVDVKEGSLEEVLKLCFDNQPFTYLIVDNMIVLKQKPPIVVAPVQPWDVEPPPGRIDVHGRVTDEKGNPIAGATVMVRGSRAVSGAGVVVVGTMPATAPAYDQPSAIAAINAPVAQATGAQVTAGSIFAVVVTDANGEFNLYQVAENAFIMISSVGFETQELRINKKKEVAVRMKIKVTELKNIEVTYSNGYQVLSRERATGSFSKPDMETFKARVSTQDLIQRLDGLVPGMVVAPPGNYQASRSGNGKKSQSSLIRGQGSLGLSTEPLYVLNGVPVPDFSDINPDDVQDITVLKDAAAAAIWGAQAANGVVVVVTKTGRRDSKFRVNYSGYINYQGKPDFKYMPFMNSRQYIQTAKETFDPVYYSWGSLYNDYIAPHEVILYNQCRGLISPAQANASLDSLSAIDNIGQIKDLWYRNAFTTNHTISLSGGGSIYSFYGSLSYTDMQSNRPGEKNNAYRLNFTQDINATRDVRISLSTNLNNTISSSKRAPEVSNRFIPYQLFKDAQGHSLDMDYLMGWSDSLRQDYQARSRINLDYNPFDEFNRGYTKINNIGINLTANINVHLWRGLSFLGTYSYGKQPGVYDTYDDHSSWRSRKDQVSMTIAPTAADIPVYLLPNYGGTYYHGTNEQRDWTVRNQLTYIANPRDGKDDLSLQVGQEARESMYTKNSITLEGYDEALQSYAILDYKTLSQGVYGTVTGYGGYYQNPFTAEEKRSRFTSYFALANYTFDHKYSVDLSWRQDHSNLFGSDQSSQNRPIWSFGAKWQTSKENFMKTVTWVSDLGLRATYGITGNSPYVGAASSQDILYAASYVYPPPISGPALGINNYANRTLNWETTKTFNIGIDFALLKKRLSGNIDLYHRNSEDLLGSVRLNPFTGTSSGTGNIGSLVNKGIEIGLTSVNLDVKDFSWSTRLTFAWNKNKLVSYSTPSPYSLTDFGKTYASYWIGYAVNPVFAYKWAGLDNMGDPQIELKDKSVTKKPNIATVDDVYYKGTRTPVFSGGLSNTFRYKDLSLAVNMIYSLGHVMRDAYGVDYVGGRTSVSSGWSGNLPVAFANRWKNPGDENVTTIPSYISDGYISYTRRSYDYFRNADINVISASFVKIRDITLNYTLPHKWMQAVRADNMGVYFQAANFLVWKANHRGIDPEFGRGLIQSKHPLSLGVNVSF
ncbi:SusC/RagA family TonB-linked outer membrane protein [Flavitalea sp. BT771]|uniref:SusC/RagA family TonB-linked outer membrane protein n=1 Tax=Flavitalea sp. BT771 TaxID=3063329 RepID=UPI0026E32432|nr:SusC/RagA family TonB-linked outer membrane protein [Flavitalea sp. BT771]MDO6432345.1 SusC/RagA family TonB-linked outer membrane protein [Flavitalea sp. BT771]MDV6221255.1 SusC/RagA family TonB-linked outer membrane protein [Flavitalea sp. BT771]